MEIPPGLDVAFLSAACSGDIPRLQWETPLFQAVMGKHRPTTIFLLDNDADVTKCNNFGDTPLHFAALRGSKEIGERLISKCAHVGSTSQRGTALHFAAMAGNHDVLKYLLDLEADVHPNISSLDLSPLFSSIFAKFIECMELLLKAGEDPNHQCYQATPFRYAETVPDEGLVRCLLKAGANPNLLDSVGYTPLDHAALLGHREVVELLFPFTSRIACYPD